MAFKQVGIVAGIIPDLRASLFRYLGDCSVSQSRSPERFSSSPFLFCEPNMVCELPVKLHGAEEVWDARWNSFDGRIGFFR